MTCPCQVRAIAMLIRYKTRGVYVVRDKLGKDHCLLSLHIKGTLLGIFALDENNEPCCTEMEEMEEKDRRWRNISSRRFISE